MDKYLLISLGHSASAIFINGNMPIGYEQERLDGIKATSQFPHDAISEIIKNVGIENMRGCTTFISHWFDTNETQKLIEYRSKYITESNLNFIKSFSNKVVFVDDKFTHHDAHAYSSLLFFNSHLSQAQYTSRFVGDTLHLLVADGFGNNGEVLSLYRIRKSDLYTGDMTCIKKIYGYKSSLGLMYQYATSFCGMKENQDEYKFLGYEAHITEVLSQTDIEKLNKLVDINCKALALEFSSNKKEHSNHLYDLNELISTKGAWHSIFGSIFEQFDVESDHHKRCIIAYFIQRTIETLIVDIIKEYGIENIAVSGGLFYNVKLNNAILRNIKGVFSVMPLAGDQGAAFGMYYKHVRDIELPHTVSFRNLCIGTRNFYGIEDRLNNYENAKVCQFNDETIFSIVDEIISNSIVNIVTGPMEFGPRALCNTSTLFLPTAELVSDNNTNNNRNDIMPCAPVILREDAGLFFDGEELDRVVGSDNYMICTHRYKFKITPEFAGAMHFEPIMENGVRHYTGRPQLIGPTKSVIRSILEELKKRGYPGILVNTSFNAHGKPIAFNTSSIVENYEYQLAHCKNKPFLFVIK